MAILEAEEFLALRPTDAERQAIELGWSRLEGRTGDIPQSDAIRLLDKIRKRVDAIELDVSQMAVARMSEGRRTPRRHQRVALCIIGLIMSLMLIIGGITTFLSQLTR
jgi:hypothetical protein